MTAAPAGAAAAGPTGGRREATRLANREAILDAARDVFAEVGYGAATVRDVIRGTGLASGTFYNHFPGKEAVLRALVEESAREVRARLGAARAAAPTFDAFVLDGFRAYFEFMAEDETMLSLLRRNEGTIRTMFGDPVLGAGVDELIADLEGAVARGDVPPVDAQYVAAAMAGVGLEVALRMVERDPVDVEGAARFAAALFLGGVERVGRDAG